MGPWEREQGMAPLRGEQGAGSKKAPSECLVIVRMMDRGWEGEGGGPILVSKSEF